MSRSLRARLLLGTTAVTAAAVCALGAATDAAVRRIVVSEFDAALLAKGKSLASMVEERDGKVGFEFDPDRMPEFAAPAAPDYFEIWLDGKPFARSASLGSGRLAGAVPGGGDRVVPAPLADGRPGRVATFTFAPYFEAGGQPLVPRPAGALAVARDTLALDRTLSRLRWAAAALCVAATAISGLALALIVRRATRPVGLLAARIGAVRESDLAVRFDPADLPAELSPVADRLNGLLARLAAAFDRERAFAADVAHELRTPVAGLLATLEVCRTRLRAPAEYEAAIDTSLGILGRMQGLTENLLLLARAESGQLAARPVPVDVGLLAEECWAGFAARAAGRGLAVTTRAPGGCVAAGDPGLLRIVLANLFDNAVSHADAGGRVSWAVAAGGGGVTLDVANTGGRLTAADAPHVFDRFWRGDASRSETGRHAGLGLSLCRRLLAATGAEIAVTVEGGTFAARVTFHEERVLSAEC